jgi:hypothetical protein
MLNQIPMFLEKKSTVKPSTPGDLFGFIGKEALSTSSFEKGLSRLVFISSVTFFGVCQY